MVLIVLPGQGESLRFGVTAGRTVGNAVRRNRAKRLIRSAILSFLPLIKPGWDIIVIARRLMVNATLGQTRSALQSLLLRSGLINETGGARIEE